MDRPDAARLTSPLYPYMFVLSDGRVFDAGPDKITRILYPATATWTTVGTSPIDGMSAVMYRPEQDHEVRLLGRSGLPRHEHVQRARSHRGDRHERGNAGLARDRRDERAARLPQPDAAPRRHRARERRRLDLRRRRIANSVLPAEIWNPDTETWTEVDSLQNGRLYHSTALLLPDGRVLMAGGGQLPSVPTIVNQRNAEIYSPPYLFKGPRPTITAAPSAAAYGATFDVTTPNAASSHRSR